MNIDVEESTKDCYELLNTEQLFSPIVLKGSNVVEGLGQMLVLAVGKNTIKSK